MNQTKIRGIHYLKKKEKIWKKTYTKEVQRFLDRGKTQGYAENAAFNTLFPVSRRQLRAYFERIKHRIKHDAMRRKVRKKTLQCFIDKDDMHFDEAAELALAKQQIPVKQSNAKEVTSRRVQWRRRTRLNSQCDTLN